MIFGVIKVLGSIPAPVWVVIGSIVTLISMFLTVYKAVEKSSEMFGFFGKGLDNFNTKTLATTAAIVGIIIVLLMLVAAIAAVTGHTNDLDRAMTSVGNSVGKIQDNINSVQNGGKFRGDRKSVV